uniref:Nucleocapsid protein n=1 Tax=Macrotermes bellicosus lispivirus 1 TaxID=3133480 RepID=A0AAT9JFM3_9MONO
MNYTKVIDNLRVHSRAGRLTSELAARFRPHEALVATLTPVVLPEVHIQVPSNRINTPELRAILLAKAYSNFYPPQGEAPSPMALMGSIASLMINVLDPRFVIRGEELFAAFTSAGMTARLVSYNTPDEVIELLNDPRVQAFYALFSEENRELYVHHRDQQLLCIGIILLTIGKSVNPDNYEGWINNRIRTFQGALGILPNHCCWALAQCPVQEVLACSYSFMSASFDLRKLFFRICISAARDIHRIAAIFREVVMFLQGVEMGHIIMIDRYIFAKYPELLRIRALRDNMEAMNNAWTYLASLDPGERYFAKLLYNKDQTAALNRNNFSLLATAAIAAAQCEIPSMRFYRGGNVTGTTGALVETVKQYLNLRLNLSYLSIMQSQYAYMTEEERKRYLTQAESVAQGVSLFELPQQEPPQAEKVIPRLTHD